MKRLRFQSGEAPTETGNGIAIVPPSQVLSVGMVPGAAGSWCQIAEAKPIWVPGDTILDLSAEEFAACCGEPLCDKWPGDQQVAIIFGQNVTGLDARIPLGDPPQSWLVIYNGC